MRLVFKIYKYLISNETNMSNLFIQRSLHHVTLLAKPLYISCAYSGFLLFDTNNTNNVLLWDTQIYRKIVNIKMDLIALIWVKIKAQTMFFDVYRPPGRFVDQLAAKSQGEKSESTL